MLPRNSGNANESLTQTGALPPGALHLLIRLQNSLRKAPLCSAPARVCHLSSAQTWWPQPDLDALIPRAVNGWGLKGMQLISPQPAWLPLTTTRGWRRPVSPWRTLRQRENSPTHLAFHAGSGGTGQGPHPVGCICIRSPALQILTSPGNTRIKLDFSYLGTPRPVRLTHKLTITQITYFLGRIRKN